MCACVRVCVRACVLVCVCVCVRVLARMLACLNAGCALSSSFKSQLSTLRAQKQNVLTSPLLYGMAVNALLASGRGGT